MDDTETVSQVNSPDLSGWAVALVLVAVTLVVILDIPKSTPPIGGFKYYATHNIIVCANFFRMCIL